MSQSFLDGRVILHAGDCGDVLKTLPDNSVDSCCVDPPYHLTSIVKRYSNGPPKKLNLEQPSNKKIENVNAGAFRRLAGRFMGQKWDGGDIAFKPELWAEVLRVLKPGGYIVSFSSSRTYHRMACAIEDAGFITHPMIGWVFGVGFPKGHSVSKGLNGKICECEGTALAGQQDPQERGAWPLCDRCGKPVVVGGLFYGGQSLKPSLDPIYMGQKPFSEKTGTANVLRWGTGAINIDACRVSVPENDKNQSDSTGNMGCGTSKRPATLMHGRWPANLCHDGSEEVLAAFPEAATGSTARFFSCFPGDENDAKRIFYSTKADSASRLGSRHPTVKPLSLIQWLCRLITPPGGTVLDIFAGTGTTGEAAYREGFSAILIEREPEYQVDIARRMSLVTSGRESRKHASAKAKAKSVDNGPLFGLEP